MTILQWIRTYANPVARHEAQTLHLLVRLVEKIDARQEQHIRQTAADKAEYQAQLAVVIDKSNEVLEMARQIVRDT